MPRLLRTYIVALHAVALLMVIASSAHAQGGMGPGPGTPHSSGAVTICGSGWTGPTSGLTHCWPMDNAHVSGTTIQDAIGSINGTAGAGVTAGTGPSGTANTARTYNGTTQPILLASDPTPGSQPITIATWVNETTGAGNDGDPRAVCFQAAGSIEGLISTNGNPPTQVDVSMASLGAAETNSASGFSAGAWHHLAITFDGSSFLLYVDAVLTTLVAGGLGDGCDANTWALGGRNAANRLWAGSQSTTVIYNRALSGTEITQLKNAF